MTIMMSDLATQSTFKKYPLNAIKGGGKGQTYQKIFDALREFVNS